MTGTNRALEDSPRMPRRAGQIISRGESTWVVRIFLGRDPATGKRSYRNHTVRGTKKDAQRYLDFCLNGLSTARAISPQQAANSSVVPNVALWQLFKNADATFPATKPKGVIKSRVCFLDESGNQKCN